MPDGANFPSETQTVEATSSESSARTERKERAEDLTRLNAPTVYEVIALDGVEEMERPVKSLWWSGVAAGFGISISLYIMAALRVSLDGVPGAAALEKFGYCFGFLIVVLGRLQLFTENTITPILPVLHNRSGEAFRCLARLWIIVLLANLVGTFLSASLPTIFPIASAAQMSAVLEISTHFAERSNAEAFFTAIPAGFLVAAMVWMLPSSKGFEFWTIVAVTYAIAIADTSHVIVGSTELFTAMLHGEASIAKVLAMLACTGLGNILGGTGLFAVLAYVQVSEEI
ncbi:MAG: formate/nitrite transporter family protein [Rhizobiales bacterium]|nr:formate/nitrite transporter family protein [Hyphomicrobiales bacterium]